MTSLGIVGATGAVGQELLYLLEKSTLPVTSIRFFGSENSQGRSISFGQKLFTIEKLRAKHFAALDVIIFCTDPEVSQKWVPFAKEFDCIVIDSSSAFRHEDNVPIVIPEINKEELKKKPAVIANPNCTTAIALMALYPLHKAFRLKHFFATSFQAVSGAGAAGIDELTDQTEAFIDDEPFQADIFEHPIAFNLIPYIGDIDYDGYCSEENKILEESKKILGLPELKASVTCVRVPILRSHSISIQASFETPIELAQAQKVLSSFSGVRYQETPQHPHFATPANATFKNPCLVSRLRWDRVMENGLNFWICGDQLWKGAALNLVQILEEVHSLWGAKQKVKD